MTEAMQPVSTARSALVISPFASTPRDAGHRRRVFQMTRVLADAGFHVTFLLVAFEDGWAWSHDSAALADMRAQWDEVLLVYADERIGRPPANGSLHMLDEWWDASLETMLANMTKRRFFDVVVVHNVWLSKAFDFVHPQSVRVLETHDLFWKRADVFARLGLPPAFFVIDRQSEVFGIERADIVVAIQQQEARTLLELTSKHVVNVPFYEPELAACEPHPFAHADKTRFGILGTANPFNVHGANALLAALEDEIASSFAPIEVVVGGDVGDHLNTSLPIKRLGRVPSETAFYESVDVAVLPVFEGTGFKVKTADALAVGVPLLVAEHAASGTKINRSLVCRDARDMAERMARISLRRPGLGPIRAQVRSAADDLRLRAAVGEASLLRAIDRAGSPAVIDLHDAEIRRDALRLQSWLGMVRAMAAHRRIVLLLAEPVRQMAGLLLPPGVSAPPLWQAEALRSGWGDWLLIDASRGGSELAGTRTLRDLRWSMREAASGPLADLPRLSPDLLWEPAPSRLRRVWMAGGSGLDDKLADNGSTLLFVPSDWAPRPLAVARGRAVRCVDARDWPIVQGWLMRLLHAPPAGCEIVWAGGDGPVRDAVLATASILGLPFHGIVDGAATIAGVAPSPFRREIGRRVADLAAAILPQHSAFNRRETCPPP